MKKLEDNHKEINKVLLNDLYDINNLKNDLDEILNIEDITVSETLIQATLKRANEETEHSKQPIQSKQLTQSKQPTRRMKGIPFRYGMIAAGACILLVAGINLISNAPMSKKDTKSDMASQEESTSNSSVEMGEMEATDSADPSMDDTGEGSTLGDTKYDGSDSTNNTKETAGEEIMEVPSFFDIADEEGKLFPIKVREIAKIIVYDENGLVIHNVTETSDIESLYNTFAKVDSQDHIEEVQNEKQEGQYVRQYDIIAQEDSEWSGLHVWISSVDEDTFIITRQLITLDGEDITHRIADVNQEIVLNIINTVP